MKFFDSFLEVAGNLGFLVGNNDRVRERNRNQNRSWGLEQNGFAVSAAATQAGDSYRIEVALRNSSLEPKPIEVRGWLNFFSLTLEAPLTAFGKRQIEAAEAAPLRALTLQPGEIVEADIPLSSLYNLRPGSYSLVGTCRATRAVSNVLEIRIEIAN